MDKTVAILSRTNLGLRAYENALTEAGIKYHLVGKSGFWGQSEVKDTLAYAHCCLYPQDWCLAAAIRAPYWPTKYLPKQKLLARLKELKEQDDSVQYFGLMARSPETLVETKNVGAIRDFTGFIHGLIRFKDLSAKEALREIMRALKVGDFYAEFEESPDNDPLANLSELLKLSQRHSNLKDFLDFTRRASAASKSRKGVALSTCHAAKGMEFDTVYLVGAQEGTFPHAKSTDAEEEKNIFFVGCSRAKRELHITFSGNPSPFVVKYLQQKETTDGNDLQRAE